MSQITYRINGKADNSAIDSAKRGLQSLGQVASSVQKVFTGFLAIKAVQVLSKGVGDTLSAYQTQQKAISQLTVAVANNANLTSASLKRIIDYTGRLQGSSIFGDETLQSQATLLASMNLTEEQIKNVLKAATELTSAGIGTLESNVKNLAKQFGGMTGELGESLPALKNFSKEALMAGDGVKYVAEQYAGFASNLADNTLEGKQQKISNLIGDIKEKVGALFAIGKLSLFDNLEPLLIKINGYIAELLPKIANFFINLPKIASIAFNAVMQMAREVFTLQFAIDLLKNLAGYIVDAFKATFDTLFNLIYAISNTFVAPIKYAFDTLVYSIQILFTDMFNGLMSGVESVVNFILVGVNKLIAGINGVSNILGKGDVLEQFKDIKITTTVAKTADFRQDVGKSITDGWKGVGASLVSTVKTIGQSYLTHASAVVEPLKPILESSGQQIEDILNQDLPAWVTDALAPAIGEAVASTTGNQPQGTQANESLNGGYSLFGGADMSPLALLGDAIAPLVSSFMGMFTALSSVNQILNPVQTILTAMFAVLEPVINEILTPIVGILNVLGQFLAAMLMPALQFLAPVIEAVAEIFVWLYNKAIMPMGNAIIKLSTSLYNGVSKIVNGLIKLINTIPGVNISWSMGYMDYQSLKLNPIDYSKVVTAGASTVSNGTSGSSGTSASYSGGNTYNFYITYEHSYVNGDAREIALNLRDEIRSAEKLGR